MYNREGKELGELPKGDMYIRDMKNTKGGCCCWCCCGYSTCGVFCLWGWQEGSCVRQANRCGPYLATARVIRVLGAAGAGQAPQLLQVSQGPGAPRVARAGHVTSCTGGVWHPTDKTTALTCSEDGTLRVWDVMEVVQKTVVKPQASQTGAAVGWEYSG